MKMEQPDASKRTLKSSLGILSTKAGNVTDDDLRPPDTASAGSISHSRPKPWWRRAGWPAGAMGAAFLTLLILLVNLSTLIWVSKRVGFKDGMAKAFDYSCAQAESINTWSHLGINAISTLLLGASNYCMQILSAPTRKEVDTAHASGKCVDIGVLSARNLSRVATKKRVVWWLLALSSVPLHFVANSVIYPAAATNAYDIIFATDSFLRDEDHQTYNETQFPGLSDVQTQVKSWERLEKEACINAYATWFLDDRRNLVLIVPDNSTGPSGSVKGILPYAFDFTDKLDWQIGPYNWICKVNDGESRYNFTLSDACSHSPGHNYYFCPSVDYKVKIHADRWHVADWNVEYCLSELAEGTCSLFFSQAMAITVIACNVGKCLAMFFVALRIRDDPFLTIGDAIDSFSNLNDANTKAAHLADRERQAIIRKLTGHSDCSIGSYGEPYNHRKGNEPEWNRRPTPTEFNLNGKLLFSSTSGRRWWVWTTLFFVTMLVIAVLLLVGMRQAMVISSRSWSFDDYRNWGLGSINALTILRSPALLNSNLFPTLHAFIANSVQIVISIVYLLFNGILSCMLLSREWSGFAHHRTSLRVSNPKPGQRSTYFLQLPYQYAVPLLVVSGLLHWLASQSLFLTQVVSYDKEGRVINNAALSTCGYSVLGIFLTMGLLACLFIATILLGFRSYRPGMAMAKSCSLAISAACHSGPEGIDTTAPLKWGVTSGESAKVGRCAFSDQEVRSPEPGVRYQGWAAACWHVRRDY